MNYSGIDNWILAKTYHKNNSNLIAQNCNFKKGKMSRHLYWFMSNQFLNGTMEHNGKLLKDFVDLIDYCTFWGWRNLSDLSQHGEWGRNIIRSGPSYTLAWKDRPHFKERKPKYPNENSIKHIIHALQGVKNKLLAKYHQLNTCLKLHTVEP